jgi:predicted O-methyltransferase YrrM
VFIDAVKLEYPRYLDAGVRLLRPGGLIAFGNAVGKAMLADPAYRDPSAAALRAVGAMIRDDETLLPLLLPLDDGLLLALRRC